MLDLASFGSTTCDFAFGGAWFEIVAEPGLQWALSPGFVPHATPDRSLPTAASVRCLVRLDPGLPDGRVCGVQIERRRGLTRVRSRELRAELWRLGAGRYGARAAIAGPCASAAVQGADAVVAGVSAALVEHGGGLCLHAAAVELGGCAVLFLGPSGAGKSTAVRLIEGAPVFAFDRVCVVRGASGAYVAWSLPGGARVQAPISRRRALPVAAVLRVRQGRGAPQLHGLAGARALFALRESTEVTDLSPAAEGGRMEAALQLAAQCSVGEIHTVLGAPHRARLEEFLLAQSAVYARAAKERRS